MAVQGFNYPLTKFTHGCGPSATVRTSVYTRDLPFAVVPVPNGGPEAGPGRSEKAHNTLQCTASPKYTIIPLSPLVTSDQGLGRVLLVSESAGKGIRHIHAVSEAMIGNSSCRKAHVQEIELP